MEKIIEREIQSRAARAYPILTKIAPENDIKNAQFLAYIKGATEQKDIDDEENAKALLYAVNKTAERTKKEIIEKAVKWLDDNINEYLFNDNSHGDYRDWLKCSSQAFVDFREAMRSEPFEVELTLKKVDYEEKRFIQE